LIAFGFNFYHGKLDATHRETFAGEEHLIVVIELLPKAVIVKQANKLLPSLLMTIVGKN
jgi:hypothetical protein